MGITPWMEDAQPGCPGSVLPQAYENSWDICSFSPYPANLRCVLLLRDTITASWFHWQNIEYYFNKVAIGLTYNIRICGAWKMSTCFFIVQTSTVLLSNADWRFTSALVNPSWMFWFTSSNFLLQVQFSLQHQTLRQLYAKKKKLHRKNTTRLFYSTYVPNFLKTSKWKRITLHQQSNYNKESTWMLCSCASCTIAKVFFSIWMQNSPVCT